MGRAHVMIVPLVSLCQYSWENKKQCLHCRYQMNMKSTRCQNTVGTKALAAPTLLSSVKSCCWYKNNEMLGTHNLV